MDCPANDSIEVLLQASQQYVPLLAEYYKLALQSELSEAEADRLDGIYAAAIDAPLLNFLLNELEYLLADHQGLLDAVWMNHYKDQQAWLREHLEQSPLDCNLWKEAQRLLHQQGFYNGPIDGVWGERSESAATAYRKEVQRLLRQQHLYTGSIDGELGEFSTTALLEFQRSHDLKDDGVPGVKTFSALQSGASYGT